MEESSGSSRHEEESSSPAQSQQNGVPHCLDPLIEKLFSAPLAPRTKVTMAPLVDVRLSEEEVVEVCQLASFSLLQQPSLLRLERRHLPAFVIGDLHGQFRDLRLILSRMGDPEEQTLIFLGDFVDRGPQGLEISILLLALKTRYPDRVFLLRGNHEDVNTSVAYGFYDECCRKFPRCGPGIWLHVINTFNLLPVSALLADKVLCMHGGLSPHLNTLEDIEQIRRPSIIPPYGLLCDLLWSDPAENEEKGSGWSLSGRGISFSFDERIVAEFCAANHVDVIVRAHQITPEMFRCGYQVTCSGRLITLFSAPNYVNSMNDSAVLKVDPEMRLRFLVFRPNKKTAAKAIDQHTTRTMAALGD